MKGCTRNRSLSINIKLQRHVSFTHVRLATNTPHERQQGHFDDVYGRNTSHLVTCIDKFHFVTCNGKAFSPAVLSNLLYNVHVSQHEAIDFSVPASVSSILLIQNCMQL